MTVRAGQDVVLDHEGPGAARILVAALMGARRHALGGFLGRRDARGLLGPGKAGVAEGREQDGEAEKRAGRRGQHGRNR